MEDVADSPVAKAELGAVRMPPLFGAMAHVRPLAAWLVSAVVVVWFWNWYVTAHHVSPAVLPAPAAVWQALRENLADGTFIGDLWVTLTEILIGFGIGSAIGFVLALLIAEVRPARIILYPYVILLQSVPKTAVAPMFLIWFGFGAPSKIALVIVSAFFPVLINTLTGIARTDPDQLDMLRAYCGRPWRIFLRVKLPSALPSLFAGLELGIVASVIAAVVAEYLGAVGGLGYRILMLNTNLDMASEIAALMVLSAASFALHAIIRRLGRRVVFWGNARDENSRA